MGTKTAIRDGHLWARIAQSEKHTGGDRDVGIDAHRARLLAMTRRLGARLAATQPAEKPPLGHTDKTRNSAKSVRKRFVARTGGCCEGCGDKPTGYRALHMHHVVPVCRGGGNGDDNLALLCLGCHKAAHRVDRLAHPDQRPTDRSALLSVLARRDTHQNIPHSEVSRTA